MSTSITFVITVNIQFISLYEIYIKELDDIKKYIGNDAISK